MVIEGRIGERLPDFEARTDRHGDGVEIRIDCRKNPEFWMKIKISKEELARMAMMCGVKQMLSAD